MRPNRVRAPASPSPGGSAGAPPAPRAGAVAPRRARAHPRGQRGNDDRAQPRRVPGRRTGLDRDAAVRRRARSPRPPGRQSPPPAAAGAARAGHGGPAARPSRCLHPGRVVADERPAGGAEQRRRGRLPGSRSAPRRRWPRRPARRRWREGRTAPRSPSTIASTLPASSTGTIASPPPGRRPRDDRAAGEVDLELARGEKANGERHRPAGRPRSARPLSRAPPRAPRAAPHSPGERGRQDGLRSQPSRPRHWPRRARRRRRAGAHRAGAAWER